MGFITGLGVRVIMADGIRLNKFISESGAASRRAADRLVEEGRVTINGRVAVLGDKVSEGDVVALDGKVLGRKQKDIILAFNKPRGITCTSSPDDPDNVIDFIGYPERIYSVGRLDKDSEGLLLMTNNGDLANSIMRSRAEHEKEYIVSVDRKVTDEFVRGMSSGVPILGRVTKRCLVERTGDKEFSVRPLRVHRPQAPQDTRDERGAGGPSGREVPRSDGRGA